MAKIISSFIGGYLVFMLVMWFYSAQQIKTLCQQVTVGQSMKQMQSLIKDASSIQIREHIEGQETHLFLHSTHSFGRYTCDIRYNQQRVTQVRYSFLD